MANDCQCGDFMFSSWLVFKTSSEMPAVCFGGYICTSNSWKNGDHPIMGADEVKDTDGMQCRGIGYNEI